MSDNNVVLGVPNGFTVLEAHVLADAYIHPTLIAVGAKLWASVQDVPTNQPLVEGANWTVVNNGGVNFRGDYDIEETYQEFDAVAFNSSVYIIAAGTSAIEGEIPNLAINKWDVLIQKPNLILGPNKILVSDGLGKNNPADLTLGNAIGDTGGVTFAPPSYVPGDALSVRVLAENQMAYGAAAIFNDDTIRTRGYYGSSVVCFSRAAFDYSEWQPILEIDASRTGYWVGIVTSYGDIYAWTSTGELWVTGSNQYGQLGLGDNSARNYSLYKSPISNVKKVKVFGPNSAISSAYALKTDGTLWATGYNGYGQLGIGTSVSVNNWTQVLAITGRVKDFSGSYHSYVSMLAMTEDYEEDNLWVWGSNYNGCLGLGNSTRTTTPVLHPGISVRKVLSRGNYSNQCFSQIIKTDGTIWSAGTNSHASIGDGSTTQRNVFTKATLDFSGFSDFGGIDSYAGSSYGLTKRPGKLYVWGYNGYGQLGIGNKTQKSLPELVDVPGAGRFIKVICTKSYNTGRTYLLDDKGDVYFAGDGAYYPYGEPVTTDITTWKKLSRGSRPIVDVVLYGTSTSITVYLVTDTGQILASGYPSHSLTATRAETQSFSFAQLLI